jgi:sugar phosphate isomerase/epimerase
VFFAAKKRTVQRAETSCRIQPLDDVPLGTGQVNWPAVLRQAAAVGVKHYFVEDESAAPLESVPQSVKYLQSVRY